MYVVWHIVTHHVMCSTTINPGTSDLPHGTAMVAATFNGSCYQGIRIKFYCDSAHATLICSPNILSIPVFSVPHSLLFWHPSHFVECEWSPGIFGAAYHSSLIESQTPPANSDGPKQHNNHSTAHQKQKPLLEVHTFNCRQWWFKCKSALSGQKVLACLCITH